MKNLMNYSRMAALLLLGVFAATFSACDDDAPEAENEAETITTVRLVFTKQGTSETMTVEAKDADGAGPGSIDIGSIALDANATYAVAISLLNELETPADNITLEVEEEGAEHQIFYTPSASSLVAVAYADQDVNGLPLGIATTWTTGEAGAGTVNVTLKHQPDIKSATSGIGDGETDVTVDFPVTVQ